MDLQTLYPILYKFTSEDARFPALSGILHADGYITASSAYVLANVHFEEYDFDNEGLILDRDDQIITAKFPNFKHLLDTSKMDELRDDYVIKVKYCLHNIPTGKRKERGFVLLNIEGFLFHTDELSLLFELFEIIGELPSMYFGKAGMAIVMKSQNCTSLVKPELAKPSSDDLLFTVEQAIRIDLPKLLFNDYKAQK